MHSQLREPKLGEGVFQLFVAAIVFWGAIISLALWVL